MKITFPPDERESLTSASRRFNDRLHLYMIERPDEATTLRKLASREARGERLCLDDPVNLTGPTLEPPLPRRKKYPELAYKTHEFITAADGGGIDAVDSNVVADKVRV